MIINTQLQTTETIISQPSPGKSFALLSITFTNTSESTHTFSMYAYNTGLKTVGVGTVVLYEVDLTPKDTFLWTADEKYILDSGDIVSGTCTTSNVITVTANGTELE